MTPEQARGMYRRRMDGVGETITLRRYTGTTESKTDIDVPARVLGADGSDLVGPIGQKDVRLIILHEDIAATAFVLPITSGPNSKVVVRGKELQIKPGVDDNTRRVRGEPIAYDIAAGG